MYSVFVEFRFSSFRLGKDWGLPQGLAILGFGCRTALQLSLWDVHTKIPQLLELDIGP